MRQKTAKKLKRIVKAQFSDSKNPKHEVYLYNRIKTAWNKTPRNERQNLQKMFLSAGILKQSTNK